MFTPNKNTCRSLIITRWATEHELRTKRGIVYRIVNLINGKCYIGITFQTFDERYNRIETWWKNLDNKPLIRAVEKYGPQNFKVQILMHLEKNENILYFFEYFFANFYESYIWQNGYNLAECGNRKHWKLYSHFTPYESMIISQFRSLDYKRKIKSPTGQIFTVFNTHKFCTQHNILYTGLHKVLHGQSLSYKGWTLPHIDFKKIPITSSVPVELQLITGETIFIQSLMGFCKNKGLEYYAMRKLCSGHYKIYREYVNPRVKYSKIPRYPKVYMFIDSDNCIHITTIKLKEFCAKNKLSFYSMYRVAHGNQNHHNGWRIYYHPLLFE